jgi:Caspase domain
MVAEKADGLHALLIGIDAYPTQPLRGCVNDARAIEQWLLDRVKLPPERITRLFAGADAPATDPPTHQNIRAAVEALARLDETQRVFIYYSGHGAQELFDPQGASVLREALVPVDAWPVPPDRTRRLFWDYELNPLLAAIKAKVTCVLDCCHSAGTMRSSPFADPALRDSTARRVDVPGDREAPPELVRGGFVRSASEACAVLVACEASELAREAAVGAAGKHQGYFTRALLDALHAIDERVHEARWCDVWYSILDRVAAWNPQQNPRYFEAWTRPVLGGPLGNGDAGFRITRTGNAQYVVHAGTIAGVDVGTELAVYGATPEVFPAIGSAADLAARKFTVRVEAPVRSATASAVAIGGGYPLPVGARARVIAAAPLMRLAIRGDDPVVREAIAAAADRMRAAEPGERADVWLSRRDDGELVLGDDECYTATAHGDPRTLLELGVAVTAGEVALILEHYRLYCDPVRMARRCRDIPKALAVDLLACAGRLAQLTPEQLQDPKLPAVAKTAEGTPVVRTGDEFCVRVTNDSPYPLEAVGLMCCTSDGQVELWDTGPVAGYGTRTFWQLGQLRKPFVAWLPNGRRRAYERIIAIGTSVVGTQFASFSLPRAFDDVLPRLRRPVRGAPRDFGGAVRGDPPAPERWTGTIQEVLFER